MQNEETLKQSHRWELLFYTVLFQLGAVCIVIAFSVAVWLGYLVWEQTQMVNPTQPEFVALHAAGSAVLLASSFGCTLMLLLWRREKSRVTCERDYTHLFLYFAQKHLSNITPVADKCRSEEELFAACKAAGIDASQTAMRQATYVEDIMVALRESDIDSQFKDLDGHISTIMRQISRYQDQLEEAEVLRVQRQAVLDRLHETQEETKRLENEAADFLQKSNVTSLRPGE